MMRIDEKMLLENRAWAEETRDRDPGYFEKLSRGQQPDILWIGCADSRVPADIIVNAEPGQIFAHRNIANQVIATDFNCLSVLQYAVQVLKVKEIIVCGHYGCGGVKAALSSVQPEYPLLNKWLLHVKNVYRLHRAELDSIEDMEARCNRLVEHNVIEQVNHLSYTSIVQSEWRRERRPNIHGWVYGVDDGLLHRLIMLGPDSAVDPIFRETESVRQPESH